MIYEYRVYEAAPGRMQELHARFREHTLRLFEKHGMHVIAFFTPVIGEFTNLLTYILAFDNLEHLENAWAAFRADPEWQRIYKASTANGPLVVRLNNTIFQPTDYSPLQ